MDDKLKFSLVPISGAMEINVCTFNTAIDPSDLPSRGKRVARIKGSNVRTPLANAGCIGVVGGESSHSPWRKEMTRSPERVTHMRDSNIYGLFALRRDDKMWICAIAQIAHARRMGHGQTGNHDTVIVHTKI